PSFSNPVPVSICHLWMSLVVCALHRARNENLPETPVELCEKLCEMLLDRRDKERFVNIGDVQILANNTDEASWQPVILFAVALPRDGSKFATELVRAILEKTPLNAPYKARSKQDQLEAAKIRSKQFFFLRCYTNAYQLNDPEISQAFTQLSEQLLPPQKLTDATVLASCGEAIIPYLKKQTGWKAAERAACVRTLGLIGDQRARDLLKEFLDDSTVKVAQELVSFVDDWSQISVIRQHVEEKGYLPVFPPTKLPNLNPLANLTNLTKLNIYRTQVSDVSPLANLTNLTKLYFWGTQVSDVSPLANLTNLIELNLSGTQVSDVSPLANLTNLTQLNLWETQVSDVSPLANLTNLTQLNLWETQVSDVSPLANLTNLTQLNLRGTQVSDVSPLANLTNLTQLNLRRTQVSDVSPLANLTNLKIYQSARG
ncbi:leucine-rich repeat domain-containing protein, partial [uncultured Nostoc sp.]|uniref:leucine-rich repeat domain-containing protein n=1 Tax=uncultured Nostoc sp. TaxID=340711 RepID=UPI0035CC31AB